MRRSKKRRKSGGKEEEENRGGGREVETAGERDAGEGRRRAQHLPDGKVDGALLGAECFKGHQLRKSLSPCLHCLTFIHSFKQYLLNTCCISIVQS